MSFLYRILFLRFIKKIFLLVLNAGKFEILQLDVKSQAFNWFKSKEEGKRSES